MALDVSGPQSYLNNVKADSSQHYQYYKPNQNKNSNSKQLKQINNVLEFFKNYFV